MDDSDKSIKQEYHVERVARELLAELLCEYVRPVGEDWMDELEEQFQESAQSHQWAIYHYHGRYLFALHGLSPDLAEFGDTSSYLSRAKEMVGPDQVEELLNTILTDNAVALLHDVYVRIMGELERPISRAEQVSAEEPERKDEVVKALKDKLTEFFDMVPSDLKALLEAVDQAYL
jgi:hypothetical protein